MLIVRNASNNSAFRFVIKAVLRSSIRVGIHRLEELKEALIS